MELLLEVFYFSMTFGAFCNWTHRGYREEKSIVIALSAGTLAAVLWPFAFSILSFRLIEELLRND